MAESIAILSCTTANPHPSAHTSSGKTISDRRRDGMIARPTSPLVLISRPSPRVLEFAPDTTTYHINMGKTGGEPHCIGRRRCGEDREAEPRGETNLVCTVQDTVL